MNSGQEPDGHPHTQPNPENFTALSRTGWLKADLGTAALILMWTVYALFVIVRDGTVWRRGIHWWL